MNKNIAAPRVQQKSTPRNAPTLTAQERSQRAAEFSQLLKSREDRPAQDGVARRERRQHGGMAARDTGQPAPTSLGAVQRALAIEPDIAPDTGLIFGDTQQQAGERAVQAASRDAVPQFASVDSICESIWKQWLANARELKSKKWVIQLHTGDDSVTRIEVEVLSTGEWVIGFREQPQKDDTGDQQQHFYSITSLDASQFCAQFEDRMQRRSPGIELSVKRPVC